MGHRPLPPPPSTLALFTNAPWTVEELERWCDIHKRGMDRHGDPVKAVAAADRAHERRRKARAKTAVPPPGGLPASSAAGALEMARDALDQLAETRKRLVEMEKRAHAVAAARVDPGRDGITWLLPHPDRGRMIARIGTFGSDRELAIDTSPTYLEVHLTPQDLREAAARKAGLMLDDDDLTRDWPAQL